MSRSETLAFFAHYRDAFNRLDGDAVADLWATPSGIADAAGGAARLTWWADDAPMRANHRALCDVYRGAGYGRADFELTDHVSLGTHHAHAVLHWRITRGDGSTLQNFHTAYHLVRTPRGPRVQLCTAFEENLQEMRGHAAEP